jgi:hypothetical protein
MFGIKQSQLWCVSLKYVISFGVLQKSIAVLFQAETIEGFEVDSEGIRVPRDRNGQEIREAIFLMKECGYFQHKRI